jgi:hypothetical protein
MSASSGQGFRATTKRLSPDRQGEPALNSPLDCKIRQSKMAATCLTARDKQEFMPRRY